MLRPGYRCNGMGIESDLCTLHEEYKKLGETRGQRIRTYLSLCKAREEGELLEAIRDTVNQGHALGNERFRDEIDAVYDRLVKPANMGRPRKSCI